MAERGQAWAQERREGAGTGAIARREGVTHQWVSRLTKPYGPFARPSAPQPDAIAAWVKDRRAGRSAAWVAKYYGVPLQRVSDSTREFGPFRVRLKINGFVTVSEAADHLAIPVPTLCRWITREYMPAPQRRNGRRVWAESAFNDWLANAELETCPQCGAMTRDRVRHTAASH
ncbi:helix-turn-helix transcriptional regulator [Knoellia subterranea]|uniref:helix-turn-helix transcriptional regulator n=1 Tax=Knoellia subterranea TaxID=184882 RepID=UPI0012EC3852|nr:helix-turn-helix domain-containing protein [Knoellia subterranea]